MSESVAREELLQCRGNSVRLDWLYQNFGGVSDEDSHGRIQCVARSYLLYILGSTLFADKTAMKVPIVYLRLLIDLDAMSGIAWGAGALAYLYRQLGLATRSGVRQIAGYMTMLEAWIYEHFRGIYPHANLSYSPQSPRVYRWLSRKDSGQKIQHLQSLRESLDIVCVEEVREILIYLISSV